MNDFTSREYIEGKRHYKYLLSYFDKIASDNPLLKAGTILVESDYTSRSYLHDYSQFYCLCFTDQYKPKNSRVHFFTSSFEDYTIEDFIDELNKPDSTILCNDTYLGYIIVRNLPKFLIGPTLLRPYNKAGPKNSTRSYPAVKKYCIHILNRKFELETLIFQEQDSIVSACSSVALWTAFHKTSELFRTKLITPSEITVSAADFSGNYPSRSLPSEGLDHSQIAKVINSHGLDFELIINDAYLKNLNNVKAFVYAYLTSGIPVLMGYTLNRQKHLVTIVGYGMPGRAYNIKAYLWNLFNANPYMKSYSLKKLYVHDDQTGPFTKVEFSITERGMKMRIIKEQKLDIQMLSLIVPYYNRIRIKYDDIYNETCRLHFPFKKITGKQFSAYFNWDIFLTESNKYKEQIKSVEDKEAVIEKKLFHRIILSDFPRFIWVSRLQLKQEPVLDFVFDPTDISTGFYCLNLFIFNEEIRKNLAEYILTDDFTYQIKEINGRYIDLFKRSVE